MTDLIVRSVFGCVLMGTFAPMSLLGGQSTVDFTGRSNLLVGYVTSPPQQLLGFGAATILSPLGGWGVLMDGKVTTDSPARDTFLSDRTPEEAETDGDLFFRQESAWTTVNLAAVKGLTPAFAVYLGGGASWETSYLQYEDQTGERGGVRGVYWVEEEGSSRVHPNIHAGAFLRVGRRLAFQFGGQTAPRGFTVGAHLGVL